jgi:hypothetical protein
MAMWITCNENNKDILPSSATNQKNFKTVAFHAATNYLLGRPEPTRATAKLIAIGPVVDT